MATAAPSSQPGDEPGVQSTYANSNSLLASFSLLNIRGLRPQTLPSKVPYIRDLIEESSQLVFALTETWLSDHTSAELHIPGYTLYRQDRFRPRSKRGRNSGGVAMYVRDDHAILCEIVFTYSSGVIEAIGLNLKGLNLLLVVLYRQPDDQAHGHRSTSREFCPFLEELDEFLTSQPAPTPDIVVMGDFNLPHGPWSNRRSTQGASGDEGIMVGALMEFSTNHFLVQQVNCPTHRDDGTLDLIFTNNGDLVHGISVVPSPKTDHFIVEVFAAYQGKNFPELSRSNTTEGVSEPNFVDLNFFSDRIDWSALEVELGRSLGQLDLSGLTSTVSMDKFLSACLSVAKKYVPLRKKSTRHRHEIPKDRRILMRTRRRIIRQRAVAISQPRRDALNRRLIDVEEKLKLSRQNQIIRDEEKAVENIKRNPKYFYTYAKKFSKLKVGIGPLVDVAGALIACPIKMAEILAEQYKSVFSQPRYPNSDPHDLFPDLPQQERSITRLSFSDAELESAMAELSSNSAAGPDGFPAILLKNCRRTISPLLAAIWRKSLAEGSVPIKCKTAYISPIYKGKNRALPKNYRPVALTSHLVKVFEKVVRKKLVEFMENHHLFNANQHGFRGGHSCLSQLLNHFDKVTWYLEQGKSVDVVYLDFAKAFDKVDIGITLRKLRSLGIQGEIGRWLFDFLTNREQLVLVEGKKSTPQYVTSGVPQGSVLGPLLFLILIGDIDQRIASSFISSFADDTRIGRQIANDEDVHHLQTDLEAVYEWSERNNMQFNSDKFELLRYKLKGSEVQNSTSYKSNDGSEIEEKVHIRDLGVTLSNDASFSEHITEMTKSVKSKIGWVLRTFKTRERRPMLTLWKQLVLCDLDYCSQLWNPGKTGDVQALELLQRSYLRRIAGMQAYNYWEQLKELKLFSLERRRERYIAIYIWRMLEGQVPNFEKTPVSFQWHQRRGRECHVPRVMASAPSSIQRVRYNSLSIKGPKIFNSLPMSIRNITGCEVETFKTQLDKYLAKVPDEPLIPGYTRYRSANSNSLLDRPRVLV